MASKLSQRLLFVWSTLAVAGGCGQVLGLGDYDIDPALNGGGGAPASGDGGNADTGKAGTKPSTGGNKPTAGSANGGQTGEGGASGEPSGGAGTTVVPIAGAGGDTNEAGAGNQPTGVLVPCDSADCCTEKGGKAVGVELLKDGGFEKGTPDDGSPWGEVSTTSSNEVIIDDTSYGFDPKNGSFFAYLSGISGEQSTIYQDVVVPQDAGWLTVSGYRLFQIDSQDDVNMDFSGIGFYSYPAGDLLELPFYWGRPSDSTDGWGDTATWKAFSASWDAAPHVGLKREIDFRGGSDDYTTDDTLTSSSYLYDELSLKVFRCYK